MDDSASLVLGGDGMPRPLSVHLEFRDILAGSAALRVGGHPVACHTERALDYTVVRLHELPPGLEVELIVKETATPLEKRNAAVTRILQAIQADNGVKERLHRHLTEAQNRVQYEVAIRLAGLKDAERLQLLEIEW